PVVPGPERTVIDLEVVPDDDWHSRIWDIGDGPDRLVHPVEVDSPGYSLVCVVRRAVRRLEDRVDGECAPTRPSGDDVSELISGEVTGPLRLRHLDRVYERGALHVGLAAIDRDADVYVPRRNVVVAHEHSVESAAIELGVGRLPHPVVPAHLRSTRVGWAERRAAIVRLTDRDVR